MKRLARSVLALGTAALTLCAVGGASAATILLKDTGAGTTSILNTTGELTGGDAAVVASKAGVSFLDVGFFSIQGDPLLTSFSVISQGTSKIAEISGGEAGLYERVGSVYDLMPSTVINLQTAPPSVVSQLASFSGAF
jgi:hypothetical protein